MSYVFDSSSLIYMGKLGLLEHVTRLKGKKMIPPAVYKEVVVLGKERCEPEVKSIELIFSKKKFIVKTPAVTLPDIPRLTVADREVLALAKQTNAVAVMDDFIGREVAKVAGVTCHGTVYLLLLLFQKHLLTRQQTKDALDRLLALGFYLSVDIYRETTKKIEKMK